MNVSRLIDWLMSQDLEPKRSTHRSGLGKQPATQNKAQMLKKEQEYEDNQGLLFV